ncbi:hypothetical protein A2914_02980 [Candidatus Nomurabacteria bacterium RIFCSPLOWO2_01_FULL_41_21]|uniref:Uncharacterized protein n=2 Tax=Candidatus Nomuraibacteriota TaxID=1752729 RepID=A0A1F6V3N1_9BACT|nr:MAG: hypothetical protein A2733_01875 [Candidatus Nomurabacteria bacterium RIFCSPHIGHO2_01_FULL_40_20]OGI88108.1 MAG: hypothetical protein A2914_02980 [Candidatus Nomurabacteria bacterium RIFCSPLOWO2_01_FULL_41_21]
MKSQQIPDWVTGGLLEEILNFDTNGGFVEPEEPVAEGEKVVAEMNTLHKILYTLRQQAFEEGKKLVEEDPEPLNNSPSNEYNQKMCLTKRRHEALEKLFWNEINLDTPKLNSIGVRKGFQIVDRSAVEEKNGVEIHVMGMGGMPRDLIEMLTRQ